MIVDTFMDWLSVLILQTIPGVVDTPLLAAAVLLLATASLVALCVPGVIVPMAFASSALVGMWPGVAIVGMGSLIGSQIFFTFVRHLAGDRMHRWVGGQIDGFEDKFASYGAWYVIGLRLVGAPHPLVTTASALMPIGAWTFAAATLLGLLPAIAIAAAAGAVI